MGFWWVYLLLCLLVGLPNPLRLHPTSISYVFKVFKNLDMLWMGIWVHPYTVTPEQQIGAGCWCWVFGGRLSLSDDVMPRWRLKPPMGCIPHPYDKHAKCLSTLTCCWWAYESTLILRYPPESRVNFQEFWGGDRPIWCGYIMVEPQTPLGVLHKSISYIYKLFLHLDKLWMGIWHHS